MEMNKSEVEMKKKRQMEWIEVDGHELKQMKINENGRKWREMESNGWKWREVDGMEGRKCN